MKDGPNPVQGDSHTRTGSLSDLGTRSLKHGLNFAPTNARPDRVLKNRLKRLSVFLSHAVHDSIIW